MNPVNNLSSPVKKLCATFICIGAITAIAFSLITFIGSNSPSFKFLNSLNSTNWGIVFVLSTAILILNLLWLKNLYKKKQPVASSLLSLTPPAPPKEISFQKTVNPSEALAPDTLLPGLNLAFLSYLDPETLNKCSTIQGWETLVNTPSLWDSFDLKALFPKLRIFDERDWAVHADSLALDLSDAQPFDKGAVIRALYRFSLLSIEEDAGFTLLTIPKGLTLQKLQKIVSNSYHYRIDLPEAISSLAKVDHTYRILVTNNILSQPSSRLRESLGYQLPKVLEVLTLIAVNISSAKPPYHEMYTYCEDRQQLLPPESLSKFKEFLSSPYIVGWREIIWPINTVLVTIHNPCTTFRGKIGEACVLRTIS